jgi:hypothetical protein
MDHMARHCPSQVQAKLKRRKEDVVTGETHLVPSLLWFLYPCSRLDSRTIPLSPLDRTSSQSFFGDEPAGK